MAKSPNADLKCGKCTKTFSVPADCLDRPINCPYCYELLVINPHDGGQTEQQQITTPRTGTAPLTHNAISANNPGDYDVEFYCDSCSAAIQIGFDDFSRMSGKTYDCPSCNNSLIVPVACRACGGLNRPSSNACEFCGTPQRSEPLKLANSKKVIVIKKDQNAPFTHQSPASIDSGYANRDGVSPVSSQQGLTRAAYFGYTFLVGLIAGVIQAAEPESSLLANVIAAVIQFALAWNRLKNACMSPWLTLLLLVPIVNVVIGVLLLVWQPGYGKVNRLDENGKMVLWILVGSIILIALLLLAVLAAN